MRNANSVWLNGKHLDADLTEVLDCPVRLANDADCFALSEAMDGAGREARTLFGVIMGSIPHIGTMLHFLNIWNLSVRSESSSFLYVVCV